jgi:hypothetical protein
MSCEREHRHHRRHIQEECGCEDTPRGYGRGEDTPRGYGRGHHASGCGCGCHSPHHPEPGCACGCHDRGHYAQRCTCGCHDRGGYGRGGYDRGHHGHRCACGCTCSCHDQERAGTCECEEGQCGEDCTCPCHDVGFRRRFVSRAERIEWLEAYLEALEAEAQGVRERLQELEARDESEAEHDECCGSEQEESA